MLYSAAPMMFMKILLLVKTHLNSADKLAENLRKIQEAALVALRKAQESQRKHFNVFHNAIMFLLAEIARLMDGGTFC